MRAAMNELASATGQQTVSADERRAVLANVIGAEIRRGWRVESQSDFQATFIRGHRPNHVLHLLLTIVTLGLWVIVWILVSISSKEVRTVVTVDEYGRPFEVGEGPYTFR